MEDKIKTQKIAKIGNKKYKGEVCIQLFNAKSGKLEKEVKGTNMITNAIPDIFASNYYGLLSYGQLMPLATNLFGGVLCFRNALVADADAYYPPNGTTNPIIAHAGQTAYPETDTDLTRGQPNAEASGVVSTGVAGTSAYSLVFFFPETRGNGTISSIALTHKDTGDYWLNGGSNYSPVEILRSYTELQDFYVSESDMKYNMPQFYDTENRAAYMLYGSSTNLVLRKYKDLNLVNDVSINQSIPIMGLTVASTALYNETTYTLGSNIFGYRYLFTGTEIHCLKASGSTITRTKINLSDMTSTSDTITVSNANMSMDYNSTYARCRPIYLDEDGYIYIPKSGGTTMYKINYASPLQATELADSGRVNNTVEIVAFGKNAWVPTGAITDGDRVIGCATPNGYDYQYTHSVQPFIKPDTSPVMMVQKFSNNQVRGNFIALWKMFLGTIYNLQNPITKTSTQSMTITYTLTEVLPNNASEGNEGENND